MKPRMDPRPLVAEAKPQRLDAPPGESASDAQFVLGAPGSSWKRGRATATDMGSAGAQLREWPWYVHFALATLTLLINLWAFRVEYRNVEANAAVLDGVLGEVDRIRAERGLPSNAEALEREERV